MPFPFSKKLWGEKRIKTQRQNFGFCWFDRVIPNWLAKQVSLLTQYENYFPIPLRTVAIRSFESVAKTPYERVLEHEKVFGGDKEKLRIEHAKLNPLALKRELDTLKEELGRELKKIKKVKKKRTTR